jgi:hypothetical protein
MLKFYYYFIAIILLLGTADQAYAYIDLGTGSYIAQALIVAIVGGLFLLKNYFLKVKKWTGRLFNKKSNES